MPARTVLVQAAHDDPEDVVQDVVAGLIDAVDAWNESPERVTLRREGLQGLVPLLERARAAGRSDVFFAWLAPVVVTLQDHVRRELRIRELESDLATGQVTSNDVLDEVLLRAYDRFEQRPGGLPLDLWLVRLADEVLSESCRVIAGESLEQPVAGPSTETRESARDSWTEWATFSETIELGDLLPAMPDASSWDSLDLETKKAETDRMLSRLPREQRQAIVLNTVYGHSPAAVADFQGRAEEDVRSDIRAGRHTLERHFLQEYLPELEERMLPPGRRATRRGET